MKRQLACILLLLAACTAAHAVTGLIVVTASGTAIPTPCTPTGIKLGTLPACPANSSFIAPSISLGGSSRIHRRPRHISPTSI